ncbi:hypothetical protein GCM10011341_14320 [Frigidibacter albus]|uniref:hypothetical protein n=1 Tax=Frigidibacter albus TaxID=1465486 RepID=UPI0019896535|nr:hypothetical protein [Frigidibacter albus]GGH50970.1 hypothetical protein GCM10011341_14320 [Frigidibacter albus]
MKVLRRLAGAPSLARIVEADLLPGFAVQDDADLLADCRARAGTVFHPVGYLQDRARTRRKMSWTAGCGRVG